MKVHSYRNFYRKEKKKSKSHEAILLWDKNNRLAFDNGLAILPCADGFKRNDWFVFAYVCHCGANCHGVVKKDKRGLFSTSDSDISHLEVYPPTLPKSKTHAGLGVRDSSSESCTSAQTLRQQRLRQAFSC
jgi:hypothetical protein